MPHALVMALVVLEAPTCFAGSGAAATVSARRSHERVVQGTVVDRDIAARCLGCPLQHQLQNNILFARHSQVLRWPTTMWRVDVTHAPTACQGLCDSHVIPLSLDTHP